MAVGAPGDGTGGSTCRLAHVDIVTGVSHDQHLRQSASDILTVPQGTHDTGRGGLPCPCRGCTFPFLVHDGFIHWTTSPSQPRQFRQACMHGIRRRLAVRHLVGANQHIDQPTQPSGFQIAGRHIGTLAGDDGGAHTLSLQCLQQRRNAVEGFHAPVGHFTIFGPETRHQLFVPSLVQRVAGHLAKAHLDGNAHLRDDDPGVRHVQAGIGKGPLGGLDAAGSAVDQRAVEVEQDGMERQGGNRGGVHGGLLEAREPG